MSINSSTIIVGPQKIRIIKGLLRGGGGIVKGLVNFAFICDTVYD